MEPLTPKGNLIVTLFNGFGDVFLALPVLREMRRRFAGRKVYLATYAECINLFFQDFDFEFLPSMFPPNDHRVVALRDDLDNLDVQQIVSFNSYFPNSVDLELAVLYPSLPRWAFFDTTGEFVMPRVIDMRDLYVEHMRDLYFEALGWEPRYSLSDRQVFIAPEHVEKFSLLHRGWVSEIGERTYALHLDTQPEKMWAVEKWIEVVSHIWLRWQAWPIVLGRETESSRRLRQSFPFVRKLPSQQGMAPHFAAVKLLEVFVGIDSIFAHILDSYSKPMVVLFGPADLDLWGPLSPQAFVVRPEGEAEMKKIATDEVIRKVDSAFALAYGECVLTAPIHQ